MRDLFLLDPDTVFLNHGSFGACPIEVFDAFQAWQREMERNPVAFLGRRSGTLLHHARQRLAEALGADADDLAFVPNATTGVNIVARSLGLQAGDEVLTTDHEYGACDATWRVVCGRVGAHYRAVQVPLPFDAGTFVAQLLAAVTPRTRLIFVSHITSTTALTFPVAALCAAARERGIATLIDGAHAPGQLALDLAAVGADFYTGNCHKWLCAPKGAAFLHVRPGLGQELEGPVVSWGHVAAELAASADTAPGTGRREVLQALQAYTGRTPLEQRLQWQGTRDIAAFLAVPAAIDFQVRHGWPARRAHCHAMAAALQRRVLARNGLVAMARETDFSQMVAIPVRCDDPEGLRRRLYDRHRIEVPVTQHGQARFVRVSVQAYNTEADLARLEQALAEAGV
ncbi:MAG: aminotransferase class V-fold PLP-dependent enzyme [Burkholderiales bacterium]|nr:aminotransferase class V-fold PLP-dependent enzyme [Burkholderiales bacterium]